MERTHFTPVEPGAVLQDELEETGLSQTALANHIGVLPKTINEICRGKRGISADMAIKLSRALGGSPRFWLNLQNQWELSHVDGASFEKIQPIPALKSHPVSFSQPLKTRPKQVRICSKQRE